MQSFTGSRSLGAEIIIAAPKIAQAVSAALADVFTYELAQRVHGTDSRASCAVLALTLLSPWNWFCSTRTLSNALETTLTAIALHYWPWSWLLSTTKTRGEQKAGLTSTKPPPKRLYASLALAALACILRPTNVLIWATLAVSSLWTFPNLQNSVAFLRAAIIIGSIILALTTALDAQFYARWTFPPLRFIYFNVVQSLAVFYGRNRPDYYVTEGLYLLLTTATPFAALGMWRALYKGSNGTNDVTEAKRMQRLLALPIVTSLVVFSLISHKEVRFIYPLLPMLHVLAAKPLATFFSPFPIPRKKYRLGLLVFGLAVNLFIAYYTSYVHQRGVIDVIGYLRHEQENVFKSNNSADRNITVGFLMPCHSTPWRSHLVYPQIHAWALTCEPPLHLPMAERESYLDEADVFYNDPIVWLDRNMGAGDHTVIDGTRKDSSRRSWPQYLVFFEQLEPTMRDANGVSKYQECWRGFNTHWHDDWRRQGDVVVWCQR